MQLQTTESERDFLQKQKEETTLQMQSLSDDLTRARAQVSQVCQPLRCVQRSNVYQNDEETDSWLLGLLKSAPLLDSRSQGCAFV